MARKNFEFGDTLASADLETAFVELESDALKSLSIRGQLGRRNALFCQRRGVERGFVLALSDR